MPERSAFLMQVTCKGRGQEALLHALKDWEGVTVLLTGITNKANHGFIFLKWDRPIPEVFRQKMREDDDVLDYLTFPTSVAPPIVSSTNGKS